MRILIIALLLLATASVHAQSLDREAALADIELAREVLSELHAGYDRYSSSEALAGRWDALEEAASEGLDRDRFFVELSGILAAIACDHTKAEFPQQQVDARESAPVYLPFRFRLFGEPGTWRMLVEHSGVDGLGRGDEILSIDGDPVSERIDAIWPLMPVDGRTTHVRRQVLASSSEFLGSGFDHFDPLINTINDRVELEVMAPDGVTRELAPNRIGYAEFRQLGSDGARYRNFSDPDAVELTIRDDGQATLSISTFVNYRTPVDPGTVFDPFFEELKAKQVQRLIVDMRQNGGGSVDAQIALVQRLIKRPVQPVSEIRVRSIQPQQFREHLSTWEQSALNPDPAWFIADGDEWILRPEISGAGTVIEPHPLAFAGELIVLIGPANSSGATTMIGAVAEAGDAVLVGEPTGGNQAGSTAGILYYLTLPNSGVRIRVPAQRTVTGFQQVEDGEGYAPDLAAPLTLEAWRAERACLSAQGVEAQETSSRRPRQACSLFVRNR
ncbi:MAG: S41 family peptidase [Pseudomonadota bacterium]